MNETLLPDEEPSFFGLALHTHRVLMNNTILGDMGGDSTSTDYEQLPLVSYFQYEAVIAAIAIFFFRSTVRVQTQEPAVLRWFFCLLLAALAYTKKSYELLAAVEIFSFVVSWLLLMPLNRRQQGSSESEEGGGASTAVVSSRDVAVRLLSIATGAVLSMVLSHTIFTSGLLWKFARLTTPAIVIRGLEYMFPVAEMKAAYDIMHQLALEPAMFKHMMEHLFFVTFHIQIGMGYLGIGFLREEQSRRNKLIRLDVADEGDKGSSKGSETNNGSKKDGEKSAVLERSRRFQRGAAPYIFGAALPYMLQIIIYGNINKFAFSCVQDDLHRTIRFRQVFEHDNHLTAMALDSPTSPEAYATSMNTVVSTVYNMFNRKLFSLPKVLLLPAVISRQPMLVAQVFPFIFLTDWLKAAAVSYMTTEIELLQKEMNELNAVRSKVESFDIKNAELLQRSGKGATQFTQRRWEELTVKVQARVIVSDLLVRSKAFFEFMQRNFVFTVLIDCALANLIAIGKIVPSEIFVFSRAIEDAVDLILMRTRGEAELARMMTEIEKLEKIRDLWDSSKEPNLLRCRIEEGGRVAGSSHNNLILRNLHYSRGTASARADHIELSSGVYALTGSNGSGKSTLFRILMSCNTNEKSIDLPSSINLLTPVEPLTEEEDLLRERACLASIDDEDGEADESCLVDAEGGGRELERDDLAATSSQGVPTDMPHHIPRLSITMPSAQVVEISQNFYWPLYSKPIDWIYQDHVSETCDHGELQKRVRRVAEELHSLAFFQSGQDTPERQTSSDKATGEEDDRDLLELSDAVSAEATISRIMSALQEEKEDWFSDLSGGQKSKVELVRIVFLRESCPDVLLVDETMAPLDPASKELVMAKLKLFCSKSIIIVIYHTDVGQGKDVEGKRVDCVPSNNFFGRNIHLDRGVVHVRETC